MKQIFAYRSYVLIKPLAYYDHTCLVTACFYDQLLYLHNRSGLLRLRYISREHNTVSLRRPRVIKLYRRTEPSIG